MKFKKSPLDVFLKGFEYGPRPAISLLIKNVDTNSVLLTKRAQPPFAHFWHLPGSFPYKGETLNECIDRILKDELGVVLKNEKRLIGIFDDINADPRGHVLDIIYSIELSNIPAFHVVGATEEIKFFKKMPENIGFNHKETLRKLGFT